MNILIGISGGIAAYKMCDLVRLFMKDGHEVKTIVTENAKQFVTTVTLETLTKSKCYSELFTNARDVEHISLAKWADVMVIAPATANTIGKISNGVCDDLLTTVVMALDKPCYIFPSMNTTMYAHPSVQENIGKLRDWGYLVYDPEEGELACGDSGKGRLPDVELIYEIVIGETERAKIDSPMNGKNVIITAGSTKAYIDPVRYIVNSSSGTMGVELVRQTWLRGANVTLVCNKEVVDRFPWVTYYCDLIILVETTQDVLNEVTTIFNETDLYISAAALCDFDNDPEPKKIKKSDTETVIKLKPSVDVFSELSKRKTKQFMVGFALESDSMEENAAAKLRGKGMDLVIANTIDAIGSKSTRVAIMDKHGIIRYVQEAGKRIIASEILKEVEKVMYQKNESRVTSNENSLKTN
jgi:phosphopantothenoylcysteine decarboxylase/phosphopantothenate--cysteine ligase